VSSLPPGERRSVALDAPPAAETQPKRRLRPVIGFAIGAILLAAAIWAVASQRSALDQAWRAVQGAPWWLLAAALVLPLLNWIIVSVSFWIMMRRYGGGAQRIGYGEMACLIGASWLLNYLPLRAGMVGRVAYHRTVNNIPIADSLRVTVYGLIFAAASIGVLLVAAVLVAGGASARLWAGILAGPALVALVAALTLAAKGSTAWWLPAAFGFRYLDTLVWVARYMVVFALVGASIDPGAAVAIAAVSQIAILQPLVGNGLGVREWAVAWTAAALPAGLVSATGEVVRTIGLAADLANRAAELLLAVPVGLISTLVLARRMARQVP
jgi:hypothetical protein